VQNIRIVTSSDGDVQPLKSDHADRRQQEPRGGPAGQVKDGINYIDDKTVILSLLAPRKDFVFVTGDFNAWKVDPAFQMKKTPTANGSGCNSTTWCPRKNTCSSTW
jgi:hypothetical protein